MTRRNSTSVHRYFKFEDVPVFRRTGPLFWAPTKAGLRLAAICAEQVQHNNHVEYVERRDEKTGTVYASGCVDNPMRF